MKIEKISIVNDGYIHCNSCFYSARDILSIDSEYCFEAGINKLYGEIDSGVWAISYLLSMYKCKHKDFVLFKNAEVMINDIVLPLKKLMPYSCYMDISYPLFSTKRAIKKLIAEGIRINKLNISPDEIRNIFNIDAERFERPLSSVGNEIFKAMAAIGYCYNKQLYCFPWLSKKRFEDYHANITDLLTILESQNKIVVLPIGTQGKKL